MWKLQDNKVVWERACWVGAIVSQLRPCCEGTTKTARCFSRHENQTDIWVNHLRKEEADMSCLVKNPKGFCSVWNSFVYFWHSWNGIRGQIYSNSLFLPHLGWSSVIQLKLGRFFLLLWKMKKEFRFMRFIYDSLRADCATNYKLSL